MNSTCLRASLALLLLPLIIGIPARGDEGMWPLYDLHKLDFAALRARGLELTPEQVYNKTGNSVADAVIKLGGGSASFVSADGLIVTNHHVALGALQRASTAEVNYIRDGFYADSMAAEISAIGYNAYVTLAVEDVSEQILAVLSDKMTDLERYQAIEQKTKQIIRATEAGRDVKCTVAEMFPGRQYVLYTQFVIRDIRIVYAPPSAIGNFGADIDNWMWPRHCGDFSFVRAYVAPGGRSAEFSTENVPYQPVRFLPISSHGLADGDLTIMIGYPGRTKRHASSFELDFLSNEYFPWFIAVAGDRLNILNAAADTDPETAVRVASSISGISNYYKKTLGLVYGFHHSDIVSRRRTQEAQLNAFIGASSDRRKKYATALPALDSLYRDSRRSWEHDNVLSYIVSSCDYLSLANSVYTWAVEADKPDDQRKPGYQERDRLDASEKLKDAQINLVPSVDRNMLIYFLLRALDLPESQRVAAVDSVFAGVPVPGRDSAVAAYVDRLYGNTVIGNLHSRLGMFEMSRSDLNELDDAFVQLARALRPALDAKEKREKVFEGALSRLTPKLEAAYAEWQQERFYPDANSTRRFNVGNVCGVAPRDGVLYKPFTTLSGILEKETGVDPFIVPAELSYAYREHDFGPYEDSVIGDVPINFLTSNTGTNGNSGSPVINGRGELVGLDFDSMFEGIAADYMYDPAITRAIVVDARYMLFLIDRVYHRDGLLQELTVQ
jgi:hypothetical protein